MKAIFFDLDGTLIDSKLDLAISLNKAFKAFNLPEIEHETIYGFVGNGVRKFIEDSLYSIGALDRFNSVFEYFLNYYEKHLLDNTKLYNGMFEVLNSLKRKNKKLFIVSNKSFVFINKIVKALNIKHYFSDIVGGDSFLYKKPHPMPIFKLLERHKLNPNDSAIVGDSENDIKAGQNANITIIWAAYGFRDHSILNKYTVDFVINKPKDLLEIIF